MRIDLAKKIETLKEQFECFIESGRLVNLDSFLGLSEAEQFRTRSFASEIVALGDVISSELENIKMSGEAPVTVLAVAQLRFYSEQYSDKEGKLRDLANPDPQFVHDLDKLFSQFDLIETNVISPGADHLQRELVKLIDQCLFVIEEFHNSECFLTCSLDIDQFDEEILVQVRKLVSSKLFRPQSSLDRVEELRVVTASRPRSDFPQYIRERMREVNEAYIAGLDLAAIASSRALLEFSIADRAKSIGFNPYDEGTDEDRLMSLNKLITNLIRYKPELQNKLEYIQSEGNSVLHPPRNKKVRRILPNQRLSLESVKAVFEIVSELYAKQ